MKRYAEDFDEDRHGGMHFVGMIEDDAGEWVRAQDALALEARIMKFEELIQAGLLVSPSGPRDCTSEERAVLETMAAVPLDTLQRSVANTLHADEHSRAPARAELARREAK